jgi:ABC-type glycerol-3-phosphate transport system substrate-binding protein
MQADEGRFRGTGGWAIDTHAATLAGWIYAFGGEIYSQDKQRYRFDAPETQRAFIFLKELVDDGCAWFPEDAPLWAEFAARKALLINGSTAGFSAQNVALANASNNDRWTSIPFPSLESRPSIVIFGPSLAIVRSTPERQLAAWLFLKWLVIPENQADLVRISGVLPVRVSALKLLEEYGRSHRQWASTVELLPYAHVEPGVASWRTVRLVLSDAGGELFSPAFNAKAIPDLIRRLQTTAEEIHAQFR